MSTSVNGQGWTRRRRRRHDEDVRLDAIVALMEGRADGQVALEPLERLLQLGLLDGLLPELGGIFATDIDEQAIVAARRGIYPERIANDSVRSVS